MGHVNALKVQKRAIRWHNQDTGSFVNAQVGKFVVKNFQVAAVLGIFVKQGNFNSRDKDSIPIACSNTQRIF
jgi:hypothetical protein